MVDLVAEASVCFYDFDVERDVAAACCVIDESESERIRTTFRDAFGEGGFLVVFGSLDFRWVEIATKQLLMKSFQLDPINDVNRINDIALPFFVSMFPEYDSEFDQRRSEGIYGNMTPVLS